MSLLQLLKRFKLHVVKQRKPTLFSWGKSDYPTSISVNIRIIYVFSMNFTHFHEIVKHEVFFHCHKSNWPNYENTEKPRVDRASLAHNVYKANFSVKTRLEYAFPIV